MYLEAKSCLIVNDECSEFIKTSLGVRQGENLSPLLFALFLNDMKVFLGSEMNGSKTLEKMCEDLPMGEKERNLLYNLFLLLYADDTVIFSENCNELQKGLNLTKKYCDKWDLKLNVGKCKVVIFSRGKVRKLPILFIGDEQIDVVSEFNYLGLKLNYNNKMFVAQKDLYDRASRAMFSLLQKASKLMLPIDIVLDLFDKTVIPVLLYGCEIWGYNTLELVNKLQIKFYKFLLKLRDSTPSVMVFGETGKLPLSITIKVRMLCFWFKLACCNDKTKISSLMYKILLHLYRSNIYYSPYLKFIEKIHNELGLSNIWLYQNELNISNLEWYKEKCKQILKDQFMQNWLSNVNNDQICYCYRMFKQNFGQEPYFSLLPNEYIITLVKFLTTNNALPVNRLRFTGILRKNRICTKCHLGDIGDEFHFILVCPFFSDIRGKYIPQYFCTRPNCYKYHELFTTKNKALLLNLRCFILTIQQSLN